MKKRELIRTILLAVCVLILGVALLRIALADSWRDDLGSGTATLQASIDRAVAQGPGAVVDLGGRTFEIDDRVAVRNARGLEVRGPGTIRLITDRAWISLEGTLEDVTFRNVTFRGIGRDWPRPLPALGSTSGQTVTRLRIVDCTFQSLPFALYLNADRSGRYRDVRVDRSSFTDLVWDREAHPESGHGLGIVVAGAHGRTSGVVIEENTFRNAGRHAVYIASASGVRVSRNRFWDHRRSLGNGRSPYLGALQISRSCDVVAEENDFVGSRDVSVSVTPSDRELGYESSRIAVTGNTFRNGSHFDILVGVDSPHLHVPLRGVRIENNRFERTHGSAAHAILVLSGLDISVQRNRIEYGNQVAPTVALRFDGYGGSQFSSGIVCRDNTILAPEGAPVTGIAIGRHACEGDGRFEVRENRLPPSGIRTGAPPINPNLVMG
jgi:hypothetical protein